MIVESIVSRASEISADAGSAYRKCVNASLKPKADLTA
jgi:hypothetical protein